MITPLTAEEVTRYTFVVNGRLIASSFLRGLATSPKPAFKALFEARLSRRQLGACIALLGGECLSYATCTSLVMRGALSTSCALAGSGLLFLLLATIAAVSNVSKWRSALAWEAVVQLPAALVSIVCTIAVTGFNASRSVALVVHPFFSVAVSLACATWIVAWKAWGREARQVHTGSLLDVVVPVAKLVIDIATLLAAATFLCLLHASC